MCSWSNLWVSARRAGNATAEAEAADMLISAQDWPAITDIDPVQENPTTTQEVLDTETGEEILRLLRARCDAGAAGVLVTHEARHAAWADRVVFLRDGVVVDESGSAPVDDLLEAGHA